MESFARRLAFLLLSGTGLMLTGCGTSAPAASDQDSAMIDELLNSDGISQRELAEPADPIDSSRAKTHNVSQTRRADGNKSRSAAKGDLLELRLQEGDRFPLVKTIQQTLQQRSEATPAFASTRLEMMMIITVEEVKQNSILLGVRYSQVSYAHDVAGQQLSYDSRNHQGSVPWDALPYAGMVNNGFSFWLGRNNSIREMVGYKEFLERCVAQVPLDRRATLLSEISNRFGDDGVANFVDDSIGMLPYDTTVDPDSASRVLLGDMWTRERRLMQPVPVQLISTYRLTAIDDKNAEIDITGRVAAGDAAAANNAGHLRISGGHSLGRCIVDRATGLPLEMNLTRFITMQVTTSDQQVVTQDKTIITTIRTFPEVRGPVAGSPATSSIQRVSGTSDPGYPDPLPLGGLNSSQQTPRRAVRAVYPE